MYCGNMSYMWHVSKVLCDNWLKCLSADMLYAGYDSGKGRKQALCNNDEISLVLPKNKGFFLFDG